MKIRYIYIFFSLTFFFLNSPVGADVYTFTLSSPDSIDFEKVNIVEKNKKIYCLYLGDRTLNKISTTGVSTIIANSKGWFLTDGVDVYNISGKGFSVLRGDSFHSLNLKKSKEQYLFFLPEKNEWNNFFNLSNRKKYFLIPDRNFKHILFSIDKYNIEKVHTIDLKSEFVQPLLYSYQIPGGLVQKEESFPYSRYDNHSLFVLRKKLYFRPLYFYDLNKDNRKDIIIQEKKGAVVYLNNGKDEFPGKPSYFIDKLFLDEDTRIFDVNGDGYNDLVKINRDRINFQLKVMWGEKRKDLKNFAGFAASGKTLKKIIPFGYGFYDIDKDGQHEFIYAKYEIKEMSPIGFVKKLLKEGVYLQFVIYNISKTKISFRLSYSIFIEFQPFNFFFIEDIDCDNKIEICIIRKRYIDIYKILSQKKYSRLEPIKIPPIDRYFVKKINGRFFLVGKVRNENKILVVSLARFPGKHE